MDRRVEHHFLTRVSDGGTVSPYLAWRLGGPASPVAEGPAPSVPPPVARTLLTLSSSTEPLLKTRDQRRLSGGSVSDRLSLGAPAVS